MRTLLNLLPPSDNDKAKYCVDQPFEVIPSFAALSSRPHTIFQYSITEVWSVPFVGTVVNGIVGGGSVKVGDSVM